MMVIVSLLVYFFILIWKPNLSLLFWPALGAGYAAQCVFKTDILQYTLRQSLSNSWSPRMAKCSQFSASHCSACFCCCCLVYECRKMAGPVDVHKFKKLELTWLPCRETWEQSEEFSKTQAASDAMHKNSLIERFPERHVIVYELKWILFSLETFKLY
jgi:hypothetical protein